MYKLLLAGPLGQSNSAWSMFWHGRCFGTVDVLAWSMFEVPQEMSLADTVDLSARSMFWCSRCLRSLRECQICSDPYTGRKFTLNFLHDCCQSCLCKILGKQFLHKHICTIIIYSYAKLYINWLKHSNLQKWPWPNVCNLGYLPSFHYTKKKIWPNIFFIEIRGSDSLATGCQKQLDKWNTLSPIYIFYF